MKENACFAWLCWKKGDELVTERDGMEFASDESLDDLGWGSLRIFQPKKGNRFSLDAVLLAHFVRQEPVSDILDIGTGNGVLPLLLAYFMPEARIAGIELQPQLVARAQRNITLNRMESRVRIYQGDIRDSSGLAYRRQYDLIVSNPPFFKMGHGTISSNPELAMARHEITLTLEDLLMATDRLLSPTGRLAVIYRIERLKELREVLPSYHLSPVRLRLIQSFPQQAARLFLLECGREEPPILEELPPLIIYWAPGTYSDEVYRMVVP